MGGGLRYLIAFHDGGGGRGGVLCVGLNFAHYNKVTPLLWFVGSRAKGTEGPKGGSRAPRKIDYEEFISCNFSLFSTPVFKVNFKVCL